MTKALERAFQEISKLPEDEQDAVAAWLLQELEDERNWRGRLARDPDRLGDLADEALREHAADRTQPLDPDTL